MKRTKITLIFLLLMKQLSATEYFITFTATGAGNELDSVNVTTLLTGTTLKLAGTDTLLLEVWTGITGQHVASGSMRISPNPGNGICIVEYVAHHTGRLHFTVYNQSGTLILAESIDSQGFGNQISIQGLEAGVYFFQMRAGHECYTAKYISTGSNGLKPTITSIKSTSDSEYLFRVSGTTSTITMPYCGEVLLLKGFSGPFSRIIAFYASQSQNINFNFIECIDGDSNYYPVVEIGSQLWMAENLRTTRYNTGNLIPSSVSGASWIAMSTPAYCWFENDSIKNWITYGALYNWYTVATQQLCPVGWHTPDDLEWQTLEMTLGMSPTVVNNTGFRGYNEGARLKETGLLHWNSPNWAATNDVGFSALPSGNRGGGNGVFSSPGSSCFWWTSSPCTSIGAWERMLNTTNNGIYRIDNLRRNGNSVRCVKD